MGTAASSQAGAQRPGAHEASQSSVRGTTATTGSHANMNNRKADLGVAHARWQAAGRRGARIRRQHQEDAKSAVKGTGDNEADVPRNDDGVYPPVTHQGRGEWRRAPGALPGDEGDDGELSTMEHKFNPAIGIIARTG